VIAKGSGLSSSWPPPWPSRSRSPLSERQIIAATYHQVWSPSTDQVRFEGDYLPVWYEARGGYLDPTTGELLSTWDQVLRHAQIDVTMNVYTEVSDAKTLQALKRLGRQLGS
jgi:hypothetical protein